MLFPFILFCLARYLPFPPPFNSFISRLIGAGILAICLIILAAVGQHFFMGSGFDVLACLVVLLTWLVLLSFGEPRENKRLKLWNRRDAAAFTLALFFAVLVLLGTGLTSLSISRFGALQSVDGASHFLMIDKLSRAEQLDYGNDQAFYPKGFHIATAFIQDSFHLNQASLSFSGRARLFVAQYLAFGALALMLLFYLACLLVEMGRHKQGSEWLLALSVGPPLVIFYLVPFVFQGFVPYYYAISLVALGLVYLWALYSQKGQTDQRLNLLVYLLLTFSMSMTWSLLTPLLLALLFSFVAQDNLSLRLAKVKLQGIIAKRNWIIILAAGLQLTPLFIQAQYSGPTDGWFNAEGSIRVFHYFLHLCALALLGYCALGRGVGKVSRFLVRAFVPFYGLLAVLAAAQYFTVGELRYYAVKFSYIAEILLFVVLAAWLVAALQSRRMAWWLKPALAGLLITFGGLLAIGINANPLEDWRKMYRQYSAYGYPAFFDADIEGTVNLAVRDQLDNANSVVLHYESTDDKLYGNLLVSNWVAVIQPDSGFDAQAHSCLSQIFHTAVYVPMSSNQQVALKARINECTALAKRSGREFLIVTDSGSAQHLRTQFGEATIISR